ITLNENEKILICGTSESRAWERVPLQQARYHLNIFLQNRGFFHSEYEIRDERLFVKVGSPTRIEGVYYSGQPPIFRRSTKRKTIGSAMTPAALDELQEWSTRYLRANGYACPFVTLSADPPTKSVTVHID